MKKQVTTGNPTAHICINKSRIKQYNVDKQSIPTVYLENKTEFEIELFNPKQTTILAKISLNGKEISQSGLVLKPGQRYFLDRYIDVAKKFLFETYEVGSSEEIKKAIENNGSVEINFYNEQDLTNFFIPYVQTPNTWKTWIDYTSTPINIKYGTNDYQMHDYFTQTSGVGNIRNLMDTVQTSYSNTTRLLKTKNIETGRIEQGNKSNQTFKNVNMIFENIPLETINIKLQPLSQKVNTVGDLIIKKYCHDCGSKQKPTNKFCPSCGIKQ